MKTVLLTGAAGRIGCSLRQHLAQQYNFRCLDIQPVTDANDVVVADVMNFDAVRLLKIWCSPRDLAQLVSKSLDTDNLGSQILYGISNNRRRFFDISKAKKLLKYKPQDGLETSLISKLLC